MSFVWGVFNISNKVHFKTNLNGEMGVKMLKFKFTNINRYRLKNILVSKIKVLDIFSLLDISSF